MSGNCNFNCLKCTPCIALQDINVADSNFCMYISKLSKRFHMLYASAVKFLDHTVQFSQEVDTIIKVPLLCSCNNNNKWHISNQISLFPKLSRGQDARKKSSMLIISTSIRVTTKKTSFLRVVHYDHVIWPSIDLSLLPSVSREEGGARGEGTAVAERGAG